MSKRGALGSAALAAACLLTGCHHHAVARTVAPVLPPPAASGPVVMVSVPPPTHRSSDMPDSVTVRSDIPVVKPVKPSRRVTHRPAPPAVAASSTPPSTTAAAATTPPATQVNLGQLTSSTDDPAATRDGAANALRRERDRLAGISAPFQAAHTSEIEQARRFLRSASDSWNASDYAAALALATKARVLLDDLMK